MHFRAVEQMRRRTDRLGELLQEEEPLDTVEQEVRAANKGLAAAGHQQVPVGPKKEL